MLAEQGGLSSILQKIFDLGEGGHGRSFSRCYDLFGTVKLQQGDAVERRSDEQVMRVLSQVQFIDHVFHDDNALGTNAEDIGCFQVTTRVFFQTLPDCGTECLFYSAGTKQVAPATDRLRKTMHGRQESFRGLFADGRYSADPDDLVCTEMTSDIDRDRFAQSAINEETLSKTYRRENSRKRKACPQSLQQISLLDDDGLAGVDVGCRDRQRPVEVFEITRRQQFGYERDQLLAVGQPRSRQNRIK